MLVLVGAAVKKGQHLRSRAGGLVCPHGADPNVRYGRIVIGICPRRIVGILGRRRGRNHASLRIVTEADDFPIGIGNRDRLTDAALVFESGLSQCVFSRLIAQIEHSSERSGLDTNCAQCRSSCRPHMVSSVVLRTSSGVPLLMPMSMKPGAISRASNPRSACPKGRPWKSGPS